MTFCWRLGMALLEKLTCHAVPSSTLPCPFLTFSLVPDNGKVIPELAHRSHDVQLFLWCLLARPAPTKNDSRWPRSARSTWATSSTSSGTAPSSCRTSGTPPLPTRAARSTEQCTEPSVTTNVMALKPARFDHNRVYYLVLSQVWWLSCRRNSSNS